MLVAVNSGYFPRQHCLSFVIVTCFSYFLRGRNLMFGYYLDDLEPELRFVVSSEGIRRRTYIHT